MEHTVTVKYDQLDRLCMDAFKKFGFSTEDAAIKQHMSTLLEEIRNSSKAKGQTRIYTHGEKEVEAYETRHKEGIPVIDMIMLKIYNLCQSIGLTFSDYFGDYEPPAAGDFKGNY